MIQIFVLSPQEDYNRLSRKIIFYIR